MHGQEKKIEHRATHIIKKNLADAWIT
jgi:hypothetical protein